MSRIATNPVWDEMLSLAQISLLERQNNRT